MGNQLELDMMCVRMLNLPGDTNLQTPISTSSTSSAALPERSFVFQCSARARSVSTAPQTGPAPARSVLVRDPPSALLRKFCRLFLSSLALQQQVG